MNILLLFSSFLSFFALQICALPLDAQSINATSLNLSVRQSASGSNVARRGIPFTDVKMIQNMCGGQMSWACKSIPHLHFPTPILRENIYSTSNSLWLSNLNWWFRRQLGLARTRQLPQVPQIRANAPWKSSHVHKRREWYHLTPTPRINTDISSQLTANFNDAIAKGVTQFMSFNEPDGCYSGQACMSAQAAVDAYKKYMMPLRSRGVQIGAPAITNGPNGVPWLKNFLQLCTGCVFDFQPIHWYDEASNVAYFKNYISDMMKMIPNRRIWITEVCTFKTAGFSWCILLNVVQFHGQGTTAEQTTFLKQVMPVSDLSSPSSRGGNIS